MTHNSAYSGGAIAYSGDISGNPILNLNGVSISENSASTNGGAIFSVGTTEIKFGSDTRTSITNNTAGANGGGIWLGSPSVLDMDNTKIKYNLAKTGRGGGIYLNKGSSIKRGDDDISNNMPDNIYQAK